MTVEETRLVKLLACLPQLRGHKHRAVIKMLHASTFSDRPSISDELAAIVQQCAVEFSDALPRDVGI